MTFSKKVEDERRHALRGELQRATLEARWKIGAVRFGTNVSAAAGRRVRDSNGRTGAYGRQAPLSRRR